MIHFFNLRNSNIRLNLISSTVIYDYKYFYWELYHDRKSNMKEKMKKSVIHFRETTCFFNSYKSPAKLILNFHNIQTNFGLRFLILNFDENRKYHGF